MIYYALCLLWGLYCGYQQSQKPHYAISEWDEGSFLINATLMPISVSLAIVNKVRSLNDRSND